MLRRRYLLLATISATSLSGCASSVIPEGESPTGPRLNAIAVGNLHSESHTISLRVSHDDEPILNEEVALDGYSEGTDTDEATFRSELPDEPGRYAVSAKLDDNDERTAEITNEDACRVDVLVRKDGELGISSRRDCEDS